MSKECQHNWIEEHIPFVPRWGWFHIDYKCETCGELREDSFSKSPLAYPDGRETEFIMSKMTDSKSSLFRNI
jgi:hypothetical protein